MGNHSYEDRIVVVKGVRISIAIGFARVSRTPVPFASNSRVMIDLIIAIRLVDSSRLIEVVTLESSYVSIVKSLFRSFSYDSLIPFSSLFFVVVAKRTSTKRPRTIETTLFFLLVVGSIIHRNLFKVRELTFTLH